MQGIRKVDNDLAVPIIELPSQHPCERQMGQPGRSLARFGLIPAVDSEETTSQFDG